MCICIWGSGGLRGTSTLSGELSVFPPHLPRFWLRHHRKRLEGDALLSLINGSFLSSGDKKGCPEHILNTVPSVLSATTFPVHHPADSYFKYSTMVPYSRKVEIDIYHKSSKRYKSIP